MARPIKCRRVAYFPKINYFAPEQKGEGFEDIILKVEELEALRLKDIENYKQEECAKHMDVSRQTFQNIIDSARKKVALALVEGKAIRIQGGHFTRKSCRFKCMDCDQTYNPSFKKDYRECPKCMSTAVKCNEEKQGCNDWCENKQ